MSHLHHFPSEYDLELLSAYLDGELAGREKEVLEQRLARETALRSELDALRNTVVMLRDLPRLKAPRDFMLDPAAFQLPWWRRFVFGSPLELAGAFGTAVSIALIMLAVVLNQQSSTSETRLKSEQQAASVAQGVTETPASFAPGASTSGGTPLAFAGEEFQSTLASQSTFYANAPLPSPTAVPARTLAFTPTQNVVAQAEIAGGALMDEGSAPGEAPGPAPEVAAAAPDSSGAADTGGVPQPALAPPPAYLEATEDGMDTGYAAEEEVVGSAAMPSEATLREAPESDDDTASPDSTGQFEAEKDVTSTSEALAEATPSPSENSPERSETGENNTSTREIRWLAAFGAGLLAASVILILAGRRKVF